jgi:hypothetical protein
MAELSVADMNAITVEVMRGVSAEESAVQGPEADAFRAKQVKHVASCRANGIGVGIPNDDDNPFYSGPSDPWFAPVEYGPDGQITDPDDPEDPKFWE